MQNAFVYVCICTTVTSPKPLCSIRIAHVFIRKPKCKHTLAAQFLSRDFHARGAKIHYLSFIDLFGIAKISHSLFARRRFVFVFGEREKTLVFTRVFFLMYAEFR